MPTPATMPNLINETNEYYLNNDRGVWCGGIKILKNNIQQKTGCAKYGFHYLCANIGKIRRNSYRQE